MKIHIISIFPEAFTSFCETSMSAKAIKMWKLEIELYKLNDYSDKNFGHVDDKAYGMHGQVISAEPLGKAIEDVFQKIGKKVRVIYMTPSWKLLEQELLENTYSKLWQENAEFLIICGHYEWIDQRIIELYVDYELSIGEYVLSSGELSSQVFIDGIMRLIPGVLGNAQSLEEDSFSERLDRQKEYPVYTRPQEYEWLSVPEELISGNPKIIENWKKQHLR